MTFISIFLLVLCLHCPLLSFLAEKLQIYFLKDLSPINYAFFRSLFEVPHEGLNWVSSLFLAGIMFHNFKSALSKYFSLENNPLLWSRALTVFHNSCFSFSSPELRGVVSWVFIVRPQSLVGEGGLEENPLKHRSP